MAKTKIDYKNSLARRYEDIERIRPIIDNRRQACAAACQGNKWAIENCKAVGNWPRF